MSGPIPAAEPEADRYARQRCLPEIGTAGQDRIGRARVLVVGAGGLGATLLPQLAGAGVGRLWIVDHDTVALSNLHRQTLFRMGDLGRSKAQTAAAALAALNPDCRVTADPAPMTPERAADAVAAVDLVIDAADSFAVTYALSDACRVAGVGLISASVLGRAGYVGGFCGTAPSYRAVFPDLPPALGRCATGGVMGPVVATLGALQAQMALSVLAGLAPSPLGQMVRVDLAEWRMSGFRFDTAPEPDGPCPAIIGPAGICPADRLCDLRGADEAPLFPGARRVTAIEAAALPPCPGRRTVLICASGLRAWRAAQALAARPGSGPVAILAAGMGAGKDAGGA